jgi:mannose-6-phosphate isomerase-like protein (cupin superfamily)/quercetin dioxygenase-like cupin family protein
MGSEAAIEAWCPVDQPVDQTAHHLELFSKQGFLGPLRFLTKDQLRLLAPHYASLPKTRPVWEKSLATVDPLTHQIATNARLIQLLRALIGDDVVLWGASVVVRQPGEIHPWHCDIESCAPEDGFVSVWIGLSNARHGSALRLIAGSHTYGHPIQELAARHGISRAERTDEAVLMLARGQQRSAEIVEPELEDGAAIVFDGRLWHGSHNTLTDAPRASLLLQYARADREVKIPDLRNLEWPFTFKETRPPVIAVSGREDSGKNIAAPPRSMKEPNAIASCAHPIDPQSRCKEGVSFTPVRCFEGHTENVDYLECHYSVLMPGASPHLPHAHLDEELLVVMSGAAELVFARSGRDDDPTIFDAPAGSAIYYPPFQHHTIRNASSEPVRYAMLRWRSPAVSAMPHLRPRFVPCAWLKSDASSGAVSMRNLFEGPSAFLGKLHGHVTRIEPGGGYAAHRDAHDVSIFLIEGTIAVLGNTIAAPAVVFFPAGELHDMKAVGPEPANYMVWEFHRTVGRPVPRDARVDVRQGEPVPVH